MKKYKLLILICFISTSPLWGDNLPLHLKIMGTDRLEQPQIWNNSIFLTASFERNPHFIGVAFDFEDYGIIHSFKKNGKGIYIYYGDVPDASKISYRLIVDGLWMADPHGRNTIDKQGIRVSKLTIPKPNYIKVKGVQSGREGNTRFSIRTRDNAAVSLVGTFNRWDPYMSPMKESSQGVYEIDVRLRGGDYYYYFIVDGEKTLDPLNFSRSLTMEGEKVCHLQVP